MRYTLKKQFPNGVKTNKLNSRYIFCLNNRFNIKIYINKNIFLYLFLHFINIKKYMFLLENKIKILVTIFFFFSLISHGQIKCTLDWFDCRRTADHGMKVSLTDILFHPVSDTYVKLTLLNSMGQEMSKCKTSICRGQPNPTYKETFVFQVALFQLSDVTLILSVYNKRSMKRKEMIGWISLGLNSSGEEELTHWTQMKESKGQQVCRWHSLLES